MNTGCGVSGDAPNVHTMASRTVTLNGRLFAFKTVDIPSKLARVRVQIALIGMLVMLAPRMKAQAVADKNEWQLSSPSGTVTLHVRLAEALFYSVSYRGQQIVTDSKLGLEFAGTSSGGSARMHFLKATEGAADTRWSNPFGKNNPVRDHFKELELSFDIAAGPAPKMNVVFRAYDSGVAFRYVLLGQAPSPYHEPVDPPLRNFTLSSEDTGFYFARAAAAFALNLGSFTTPWWTCCRGLTR